MRFFEMFWTTNHIRDLRNIQGCSKNRTASRCEKVDNCTMRNKKASIRWQDIVPRLHVCCN